jgi:hypothetical protein
MNVPLKLDYGGSADVFLLSEDRVLKAFRRRRHTHEEVSGWADHDAITRAQFRAEARAYEQLQSSPSLEIYAPKYFGRVDPVEYLGSSEEVYVRGCGIVLEFIPGRAQKFAHLDGFLEPQVAIVVEQMRDAFGLDQVWDGSCFVPGTRAPFTIIDFALWNAENYEMALAEERNLTPNERARLDREHAD